MGHGARKSLTRRVGWMVFWGLAWMVALGWTAPAVDAEEELKEVTGTMQKVGNFGYGIVPDDDPGTRYAPTDAVAEAFRQDGLRVVFSGTVGSADEGRGGRRWGTPIVLTQLEVLADSGAEPEDGDGENDTDTDDPDASTP